MFHMFIIYTSYISVSGVSSWGGDLEAKRLESGISSRLLCLFPVYLAAHVNSEREGYRLFHIHVFGMAVLAAYKNKYLSKVYIFPFLNFF